MAEEKVSFTEKLKKIGYYIVLPLIGLAFVAKLIFDLFFKKDTLKEALIADQGKAQAATEAKTKAEDAKADADAIEDKIGKIEGDENWDKKRDKF